MYVATVTQVAKAVKQPRGGYIPPKKFAAVTLAGDELKYSSDDENIRASTLRAQPISRRGSMLMHNIALSEELPQWMAEMKQKV